jgi:predicted Zn-dependent peptidase
MVGGTRGAVELARRALPRGPTFVAERVAGSRSIALGVWIRCGSRHESKSQAGLTHFLEHMIFRGTRKRSGLGLAKALEKLGGQVDASTGRESTTLFARIQPQHLRASLTLLAEMISTPRLDAGLLEVEKKVVLEEIESYEDDPEEGLHDSVASFLWPDHPMGRPILGDPKVIRRFTADQIRAFHAERYRGGNIILTAAGALEPDRFLDLATEVFRVPGGGGRGRQPRLPRSSRGAAHFQKPLSRTYLGMATRGPSYRDHRRYPVYLLNLILGAGSSSRLFQRIREKEGLAYAVGSYVDSYEDTGAFGVSLSVDPRNLERTFQLLIKELKRLRREGIKRWELESAKANMVLLHLLSQESVSDRMGRLALKEMLYGRQTPDGPVVETIRGVTADDVDESLGHLLDPRRFCLVTVGPNEANGMRIRDFDF